MARSFNGTSDKLQFAGAPVTAMPLTMACWFLPLDTTVDTLLSLNDGTSGNSWIMRVGGTGHVQSLSAAGGGSSTATSSGAAYSTGSWHHAAAVFGSATSRAAYIDGGNKGTNTVSRSPTGISTTQIGVGVTSNFFTGNLAEVAIWNAALTDSEVAALAAGVLPSRVRPGNIVAYWPLNGLVSPEVDFSGLKQNLTVTGTALANHAPVALWTPKAVVNPFADVIVDHFFPEWDGASPPVPRPRIFTMPFFSGDLAIALAGSPLPINPPPAMEGVVGRRTSPRPAPISQDGLAVTSQAALPVNPAASMSDSAAALRRAPRTAPPIGDGLTTAPTSLVVPVLVSSMGAPLTARPPRAPAPSQGDGGLLAVATVAAAAPPIIASMSDSVPAQRPRRSLAALSSQELIVSATTAVSLPIFPAPSMSDGSLPPAAARRRSAPPTSLAEVLFVPPPPPPGKRGQIIGSPIINSQFIIQAAPRWDR